MKKIITLLLAVALVCGLMVVSAYADGSAILSVTADKNEVTIGDTVTVTVNLSNNPGIEALQFKVGYDKASLEYVSGSYVNKMSGGIASPLDEANLGYAWIDMVANTYEGAVAQFTFKALDNVGASDISVNVVAFGTLADQNMAVAASGATISVKAHDHVWDAGTVTAPTCTEEGYTTYACTVSGCTETKVEDKVPAAGHKEETVAGKAPTCTEDGLTEGKKCSACGVITAEQAAISATGHTGGKATCASGAICDTCGNAYGEKDPANHAELVTEGAKEATCTEAGSTGTGKCNACGTELDAAIEIPALGHIGGEACCVELAVCERCGESYGELNPNSHCTYVWAEAWAGSCTHPSSDAYIYCEDCLTWWVIPEGFTYEDLCDEAFDVSELGEASGVLEDEFTVPEELIGDLNPDNHYCYESDEDYHWTTCEFGNGEREEHNWSDWEKADNYKYRYCWDCGYWDEVEISASATSPKTGDEANIALWIVMTLACGAGAVLTLKKKEN